MLRRFLLLLFAVSGLSASLSASTPTFTPTVSPTFTPTRTVTQTRNELRNEQPINYDNKYLSLKGGVMDEDALVTFGDTVGYGGGVVFPFSLASGFVSQTMSVGDLVALTSSGTVTKTASNGDTKAIGVAVTSQYRPGGRVFVQMLGTADVASGVDTVMGTWYAVGAAGKLTPLSAVSSALFTSVSPTLKVLALETKTISGSDYKIRGVLRPR